MKEELHNFMLRFAFSCRLYFFSLTRTIVSSVEKISAFGRLSWFGILHYETAGIYKVKHFIKSNADFHLIQNLCISCIFSSIQCNNTKECMENISVFIKSSCILSIWPSAIVQHAIQHETA